MKDFTVERPKYIEFKLDDDVFNAWPALPVEKELQLAKMGEELAENFSAGDIIGHITSSLQLMLTPESFEIINDRMNSQDNPVNVVQLTEIVEWLGAEISGRVIEVKEEPQSNEDTPGTAIEPV